MTKGELIFECSRALGLDDTAGTDELILMQRWASRGVVDVLVKTHCYLDIGTMALQAGVTDYRTDSNILAMDNVTIPDTTNSPYELQVVPMTEILPYLSASIASTATPTLIAVEGTLMRIAPVPSSVVTLTYIYVPKPTTMGADGTNASDSLDPSDATYGGIATEFHEAILYYMLWKGSEYDDKSAALKPSDYRTAYEGLCKDVRKFERRKSGRGMHAGRIGYPDRQGPSVRNDVYPRYAR
jgi:hypothetical protein